MTKTINGFCYQHQEQFQSNSSQDKLTASAINSSREDCIPSSTACHLDLAEPGRLDSVWHVDPIPTMFADIRQPFTVYDKKESNVVTTTVIDLASSATPEVQRELGHSDLVRVHTSGA